MSKNVYKKLQECRVELKTLPIKESGNNKFAGYTYMELGDFLPHIVSLCDKHGLCTVVSFGDSATLAVVNSDDPSQQIIFESPMSTAELKGCHAIQNLGAVETYLRRYLYVTAFDIVEHDALDSTHGKDVKASSPVKEKEHLPQDNDPPATQAELGKLKETLIAAGYTASPARENFVKKHSNGKLPGELTGKEIDSLLVLLESRMERATEQDIPQ